MSKGLAAHWGEEGPAGQEALGSSGAEVPMAVLEEEHGPAGIAAAVARPGADPAGSAADLAVVVQDLPDCHRP